MSNVSKGETLTVRELKEIIADLHDDDQVRVNLGRISGAPINATSFGTYTFDKNGVSKKVDGYLDLMVDADWTSGL